MAVLSNYTIRVNVAGLSPASPSKRLTITNLQRFFRGIGNGTRTAMGNSTLTVESASAAATGTITIATGSGTISAIINGVTTSVTWATSDTNSATLLAAAVNASANALVSGAVSATSNAGVVTFTSLAPGTPGNWTTLSASGTGATASGARLTGGTSTNVSHRF